MESCYHLYEGDGTWVRSGRACTANSQLTRAYEVQQEAVSDRRYYPYWRHYPPDPLYYISWPSAQSGSFRSRELFDNYKW